MEKVNSSAAGRSPRLNLPADAGTLPQLKTFAAYQAGAIHDTTADHTLELAGYLLSPSLFVMVVLMVVEAMLAAATTWLVINAGRRVAVGEFLITDLVWILTAQSTSYVVGVISWIFAERAGYRGFGKFMLRFARENRDKVTLLNEKPSREQVEPFLTGETFQCFFNVMYELEFALKLFLGLVFNALVLGAEIESSRRSPMSAPSARCC